MPRAVVAAVYGGPEALETIEVPSREPGPGEITVTVRAAALNPVDAKVAAGLRNPDPSKLPLRIGNEAAGVVTAVGEGAVGIDGPLAVGDEVIGYRLTGAMASELTLPAKDWIRKPPSLTWGEAAGLLLVSVTAAHAFDVARLATGETVLVHGAAGSVGRAAIQLAVDLGARVIGTAAPHRHEELRALGAEPIAYGAGLLERVAALGPIDVSLDTVGTPEALEVSFAVVADPARAVTIANGPAFLERGGKAIGGGPGADPGTEFRNAARARLVALAGAGRLHIPVVAEYPLERAREAFEFLAEGHAGGKVVLIP